MQVAIPVVGKRCPLWQESDRICLRLTFRLVPGGMETMKQWSKPTCLCI